MSHLCSELNADVQNKRFLAMNLQKLQIYKFSTFLLRSYVNLKKKIVFFFYFNSLALSNFKSYYKRNDF